MFIAFAQFFAMYVLAATMIRLLTLKFPDSAIVRPLLFIH